MRGFCLVQIEQQHLRRLRGAEFQRGFFVHRCGVTAHERFAVQHHFALGDMNPRIATRRQLVTDALPSIEFREPEIGVLVDGDGAIAARFARHEMQRARSHVCIRLLRVTRLHALRVRLDPDLQQMHRLVLRGVEFTMLHAGASGHVLHVTRLDDAAIAHRILVLQRAAQDVGDDLHVAVRMLAETHARHHKIVVDDAQAAEAHPLRIVIIREAEGVITVQPAMFGVAPFICFSNIHNDKTIAQPR